MGRVTYPPEWMIGEPCPVCGSPDILECDVLIGAHPIKMGWKCRECGYPATWADADDVGHVVERHIIERMPLHAITTIYGERGLRERLATETARFGDVAERRKIKQALQLAGRLHALDHRQREPYINHYANLRIMPTCRRKLLVAAV